MQFHHLLPSNLFPLSILRSLDHLLSCLPLYVAIHACMSLCLSIIKAVRTVCKVLFLFVSKNL